MVPNLTVRIVSKSYRSGKYYRSRAKIVDVVSNTDCIVMLPNGTVLDDVKERMLETALPKPGGTVMVIRGRDRGTPRCCLSIDSSVFTHCIVLCICNS